MGLESEVTSSQAGTGNNYFDSPLRLPRLRVTLGGPWPPPPDCIVRACVRVTHSGGGGPPPSPHSVTICECCRPLEASLLSLSLFYPPPRKQQAALARSLLHRMGKSSSLPFALLLRILAQGQGNRNRGKGEIKDRPQLSERGRFAGTD